MSAPGSYYCYNYGCNKWINPSDPNSNFCRHHPDAPYFHDSQKIWLCCNTKSYDFSEFLDIPGCKVGTHNPTKPEEVVSDIKNKMRLASEHKEGEIIAKAAEQFSAIKIGDRTTFELECTTNFSPKLNIFDDAIKAFNEFIQLKLREQISVSSNTGPRVGITCNHRGCEKKYLVSSDMDTTCEFHSGIPVFHDGSKYWSCCQIKCSDFNEFIRQKGCEIGLHNFEEKPVSETQRCRSDFVQHGTYITVTFYAKLINYKTLIVKLDPFHLFVSMNFGPTQGLFCEVRNLFDEIIPNKTTMTVTQYKLEIIIFPTMPSKGWSQLTYAE